MNTVKIKCVSAYRTARETYEPGGVYEVTPEKAAHLLTDSPGSFALVVDEPQTAALEQPPADKMLKKPTHKK